MDNPATKIDKMDPDMNFDSSDWKDSLITDVKLEIIEDYNDQQLVFDQSLALEDPLTTKEEPLQVDENLEIKQDSDNESDIPISRLYELIKANPDSKKRARKRSSSARLKIKPDIKVVFHIKDGEWLASCYGEETTDKRINPAEFDKFIKKNMELSCDLCLQHLDNFTDLQTHFQKEHGAEKAFVTCCTKKFYLRAPLVDHILLHRLPNYFTCILCSKVLTGRKTLIEHQKTHNKKLVYQCDGCDKRFHRKINLDRHKDIHVDYSERTTECSFCTKLFASKFSLKQHIYDVHRTETTIRICELCGKVCRDQPTFRRHQYEHTNQEKESFPCEICGTRLATKDGLRRHRKSQHPADKKRYFCNYCGMESTTAHALHRHVTYMHTVEPRYKCTMCSKAFKRALRLKEHMTTHTGEVLYTCPHCPKTFNSNANMHSHRKKMHRKEWEENRRHPHMGATTNATEENNQ